MAVGKSFNLSEAHSPQLCNEKSIMDFKQLWGGLEENFEKYQSILPGTEYVHDKRQLQTWLKSLFYFSTWGEEHQMACMKKQADFDINVWLKRKYTPFW